MQEQELQLTEMKKLFETKEQILIALEEEAKEKNTQIQKRDQKIISLEKQIESASEQYKLNADNINQEFISKLTLSQKQYEDLKIKHSDQIQSYEEKSIEAESEIKRYKLLSQEKSKQNSELRNQFNELIKQLEDERLELRSIQDKYKEINGLHQKNIMNSMEFNKIQLELEQERQLNSKLEMQILNQKSSVINSNLLQSQNSSMVSKLQNYEDQRNLMLKELKLLQNEVQAMEKQIKVYQQKQVVYNSTAERIEQLEKYIVMLSAEIERLYMNDKSKKEDKKLFESLYSPYLPKGN